MAESAESDPLRQLLVDAAAIDRDAIAKVLIGKVEIDAESGRLVLSPGYGSLDAARKVLCVLLARKAALLLKLSEDEAVTNAEMMQLSGLVPGTVAPMLKRLRELRLVAQDSQKAYLVPNVQLRHALAFMSGETP